MKSDKVIALIYLCPTEFVIPDLLKFTRLLGLIVRYGRLRHSGYDFSKRRAESLKELQEFIPNRKSRGPLAGYEKIKALLWVNSFSRSILIAVYYLKNSYLDRAHHLHEPSMNLCYIRIPKAGSTSISHSMLISIYKSLKARELSASEINFLTDVNLHSGISATDELPVFFTLVRNPYARIVSVYRNFFENNSEKFLYQDYLFGVLKKNLSFNEFLRRVSIIPDVFKDQHLRPQTLFLEYYRKKKLNIVILKLERPGEINSFLSQYGLTLPHLNQSAEQYDYRSYYDHDSLMLASDIYGADIKAFDYQSELIKLKAFISAIR